MIQRNARRPKLGAAILLALVPLSFAACEIDRDYSVYGGFGPGADAGPAGTQVLTLQPDGSSGKETYLHGLDDPDERDRNFSSTDQLLVSAWTFQGVPGVLRTLLAFDLSSIPTSAVISSATLSLYAVDASASAGQHSTLSGSNAAWIERVITPWDANTVTWNSQPAATSAGELVLPESTSPDEDYLDIDLTSLVQGWVNDPSTNFGLMMQLQNENYYRRLNFASGNSADPSKHPRLVVTYNN